MKRVKLIKAVDPVEYRATMSGLVGVTGITGVVVEGYDPPAGKVAVEFMPNDVGYEARDEDDRITAYISTTCLEFL